MQSDDQFRLAFEAAVATLSAWAVRQKDAATVIEERTPAFWRLGLAPHAANACAVELILHRDSQTYDIQLGHEAYEAKAIESFRDFEPLLEAVVAGRVMTTEAISPGGGQLLAVTTRVPRGDGHWVGERVTVAGERLAAVEPITRHRHWVPYRR